MTHLHIADGVLPPWLWLAGLVLSAALVGLASYRHRQDRGDRLAFLGALGALMLAASAVPIGPFGHLSFAPVVGILLGPGLGFLAAFLVNATLALLGHGGLTVVGLNALILGAGMAIARPVYLRLVQSIPPSRAGMIAAVATTLLSIAVLTGVLVLAGDLSKADHEHAGLTLAGRFALLSSPFWIFGLIAESLVTGSVVAFLSRVRPELLPVGTARAGGVQGASNAPRPAGEMP